MVVINARLYKALRYKHPLLYFSAHRHKIKCISSDSKQILDQNNSVDSGDYGSLRMKKNNSKLFQFRKKTQISIEIF